MAKDYGVQKSFDMEGLVDILKAAGFSEVEGILVEEAVWAENPYDMLPVDGDVAKYGVILARK